MKQEDSYLSYEEFRKNADNDSVKAFLSTDAMEKLFTDFDPLLHGKTVMEYMEAQYKEIQERSIEILNTRKHVITCNSPIATMINGKLKYAILIMLSDENLDHSKISDEKSLFDIILNDKDVITAVPEDFRDCDKETSNVISMINGSKFNRKDLEKGIFQLGVVQHKDKSMKDHTYYPFTEDYIDYMAKSIVSLSLASNSGKNAEHLTNMEDIEHQILMSSSFRTEDDIKESMKKFNR